MKLACASLLLAVACTSTDVPVGRVASDSSLSSNPPVQFEDAEVHEPETASAEDFARVLLDVEHSGHDWSRRRPLEVRFEWHSIDTKWIVASSVQNHKAWADGIAPFKLPKITQYTSFIQSPEPVGVLVTDYDRSETDWNQEFAFLRCNPNAGGMHSASFWGTASDLSGVESAALVREYEAVDLYRIMPALVAAF